MSSFDLHNQTYLSEDHGSNSSDVETEGEAYAPRKSVTKTLRPIFGMIENEGPAITLTTPIHNGNSWLALQDTLLRQKVAHAGKLNPGTWRQAIAQHKRDVIAEHKKMRSRSEDPGAQRAGVGWRTMTSKKFGGVWFYNYETGESTWDKPAGWVDPSTRFKMGMGIEDKPRAKSAIAERRKSGLWEELPDPGDELASMFRMLSIQDQRGRDTASRATVRGMVSSFEKTGAYSRGRSRTPKLRHHAKLQAEEGHGNESIEKISDMAEATVGTRSGSEAGEDEIRRDEEASEKAKTGPDPISAYATGELSEKVRSWLHDTDTE